MRTMTLALAVTSAVALAAAGCDDGGNGGCTPTNGGIEACGDNIDNNCNGQIDEGCSTVCSEGERRGCGGTPAAMACVETCSGDRWGLCTPVGTGVEVCGNGVDDDCNGRVDDNCECTPGEFQACGGSNDVLVCRRTCDGGRWTTCAASPGNPGREICDGVDNDCNGAIDDAPGGCSCDDGAEQWCGGTPDRNTCRQLCTSGSWSACTPTSGRAEEERCGDAEDNDCDGDIDEPEPCTTSCGTGVARCEGTTRGACVVPGVDCAPAQSETEACTAPDTDCRRGTRSRTCTESCTWGSWSACGSFVGPGPTDRFDDCYGSYHLGTDPDVTMRLYMPAAVDSHWFSLTAVDNTSLFSDETIEVDLTGLPGDFGLYLYYASCSSSAIASQDVDGRADERLVWRETRCSSGCDDDGVYYVEVVNWFGSSGCYTIRVNGLN